MVISAIYGLRSAALVFFGPSTAELVKVTAAHPPVDLTWKERFPALILLAALLFIGFWPKSLTTPINAALTPAAVAAPAASTAKPATSAL